MLVDTAALLLLASSTQPALRRHGTHQMQAPAGAQLMCVQMSLTLNAAKALRGAPAVFVHPTLFHSHVFGPAAPAETCNITEYDNLWLPYELAPIDTEQTDTSSSSSSSMGNNTSSSGSGGTSTGGSTSASETRMKALVVRLRGPTRTAA